VILSRLYSRESVRQTSRTVRQLLPISFLPVSHRRHYVESSSEGPQSPQKTQDAKDKVQKDPRSKGQTDPKLREIDELIADKFAKIRDDDYGETPLLSLLYILSDEDG
jgi:hypothetical protein